MVMAGLKIHLLTCVAGRTPLQVKGLNILIFMHLFIIQQNLVFFRNIKVYDRGEMLDGLVEKGDDRSVIEVFLLNWGLCRENRIFFEKNLFF